MKVFAVLFSLVCLMGTALSTSPLYANCVAIGSLTTNNGLVLGLLGTVAGLLVNLVSTTVLGNTCEATCRAQNYEYMVFAQGIDLLTDPKNPTFLGLGNLLGTCYCSHTDVAASQVMDAGDSSGTCVSTIANLIGAKVTYLVPNAYDFTGCVGTLPSGYSSSYTTVSGPDACAKNCGATMGTNAQGQAALVGGKSFAIRSAATEKCGLLDGLLSTLLTGRTSASYQCACATGATPAAGTPMNCNGEATVGACNSILGLLGSKDIKFAWNTYGTTLNPSGITRRNIRIAGRTPEEAFCPRPYTPCKLESGNGFECVDVRSELESCGGCLFGDQVYNATSGEDCTQIPGTALGGVSCLNGKCHVSRCRPGFEVINGRCARRLR